MPINSPEATTDKPVVAFDLEGTLSAGAAWRGRRDTLRQHGDERALRAFMARQAPRLLGYRLHLVNEAAFRQQWLLDLNNSSG